MYVVPWPKLICCESMFFLKENKANDKNYFFVLVSASFFVLVSVSGIMLGSRESNMAVFRNTSDIESFSLCISCSALFCSTPEQDPKTKQTEPIIIAVLIFC